MISHQKIEPLIAERFYAQVDRAPTKIAVESHEQVLTYEELDRLSNQMAATLIDLGRPVQEPVGLLMGHQAAAVAAILAVLKAGRAYVSLDPSYPAKRLAQLMSDSQSSQILVGHGYEQLASAIAPQGMTLLGHSDICQAAGTRPDVQVAQDDISYILYTSGSTGRPKGVVHNHRNLLRHVLVYTDTARLEEQDRLSLLSPFSFGASFSHLFGALINGATLCLFDLKQHGILDVADWLDESRVTVCHCVPTLLRHMLATLAPTRRLSSLRWLRLGGEPVRPHDLLRCRKHLGPNCRLIVSYGTTESHSICQLVLEPDAAIPTDVVPVGKAVEGTELAILDESGRPVQGHQTGEIVVRSRHLAVGYWRQPRLSEATFRPDDTDPTLRTYRTGDLGRWLPDGNLVHMGRKDSRIKIRGQSVEPLEVELAISSLPSVRDAVVSVDEGNPSLPRMVAHVVPNSSFKANQLRSDLAQILPEYMLPTSLVPLDALPLTPSGKVDRSALRDTDRTNSDTNSSHAQPANPVEARLCQIWEELLGVAVVGRDDNLFNLGGDSLTAAKLTSRIHDAFQVKLPVSAVFAGPTVADVSALILAQLGQQQRR